MILSGGPASVYGKDAPHPDTAIFELGVPILGICYGVQLMAHHLGGKVEHSDASRIRQRAAARHGRDCPLFHGSARGARYLEQPRRQAHQAAARLPRRRQDGQLALRRDRAAEEAILRPAVSSRGRPHAARQGDPRKLCLPDLRLRNGLDDGLVHRPDLRAKSARRSATIT